MLLTDSEIYVIIIPGQGYYVEKTCRKFINFLLFSKDSIFIYVLHTTKETGCQFISKLRKFKIIAFIMLVSM